MGCPRGILASGRAVEICTGVGRRTKPTSVKRELRPEAQAAVRERWVRRALLNWGSVIATQVPISIPVIATPGLHQFASGALRGVMATLRVENTSNLPSEVSAGRVLVDGTTSSPLILPPPPIRGQALRLNLTV